MRLRNPNIQLRHTNPSRSINPSLNINLNPNTSPSPSISPSLNLPTNPGDRLTSQNHNTNRNLSINLGPIISQSQNTNPSPVTSHSHHTNLKHQSMRKKRMSMAPHKPQSMKRLRNHMWNHLHHMKSQRTFPHMKSQLTPPQLLISPVPISQNHL